MPSFTLGFCFNGKGDSVVLMKKLKPHFLSGKLNGVGGSIKPGELAINAMVREFKEETGVETRPLYWRNFCIMNCKLGLVSCFKTFDTQLFNAAKTTEEEEIIKVVVDALPDKTLADVCWLLPMAKDENITGSVAVNYNR